MSFFALRQPEDLALARGPVVVEVPHAGLAIPEIVSAEVIAPKDALMRDADIWVDRLFEASPSQGAALLCAQVSRYIVDLNRSALDVDPVAVMNAPRQERMPGRGVVWRVATDGAPVLRRPLSREQYQHRIDLFYAPYHQQLRRLLEEARDRHGYAILVAGHSMPSMGRDVRGGPILTRADVVPGTLGRSSAAPEIIDALDAHFRSAGLSVAHDTPYRGGYSTGHYGRPSEGIHAVQVELSRGLYVDERTGRPKEAGFSALAEVLTGLVGMLTELPLPAQLARAEGDVSRATQRG